METIAAFMAPAASRLTLLVAQNCSSVQYIAGGVVSRLIAVAIVTAPLRDALVDFFIISHRPPETLA